MFNKNLPVILFVAILTMSACNNAPELAPAEAVKTGLENFYNVRSGNYSFALKGTANAPEGTVTEEDIQNLEFDFGLSGIFNFKEEKPIISIDLSGKTNQDSEGEQDFALEMRVDKESLYAMLEKVPDLGEEVPTEMVELFVGQWWKMPIPQSLFDQINIVPKAEAEMTAEEKALRDLTKEANFFKNLKYLGIEKVEGDKSFHYSGELDKEAMKDYLIKAAAINSQEVKKEQIENLEKLLNGTEMSAEIWIGAKDMTMRRLLAKANLVPEDGGNVDMTMDLKFWGLGKNLTVEIPKDAKDFDPFKLFGDVNAIPQLPAEE